MSTAASLDIKVVYDARSRRRRSRRAAPAPHGRRALSRVVIGLVSLLMAASLYYGTWWRADPELRIRLLMHTPLPGVDVEQAAAALGPSSAEAPSAPKPAASSTPAARKHAFWFVGTALGWEVLCTLATCALALAGGALLGRISTSAWRAAGMALGFAGLCFAGWQAYGLWAQYHRFVPDQIRVDVGAAVLVFALIGLWIARWARGLALLGAILLILSSCGSVFGLYVASNYGALQPSELPFSLLPLAAIIFVTQSLWGWILLFLSRRLPV